MRMFAIRADVCGIRADWLDYKNSTSFDVEIVS